MRVLVAPGASPGTLGPGEAAAAIAQGWRRQAPADVVRELPLALGGSGFVDVLHRALGGELLAVTVHGPFGAPVPATVLTLGSDAYVEAAQACGPQLLPRGGRRDDELVERASSHGVGELVAAAAGSGARRVVVGLGDVGANDGGAGLLAALGATAEPVGSLERGTLGLAGLEAVDLGPAREHVAGTELVAATDVDSQLLGLRGVTNVHGVRRGLVAERLLTVDAALTRLAHLADRGPADARGAGAGGGVGYALLLLGASARPGSEIVAEAVGLSDAVAGSDLVVTGAGSLGPRDLYESVVAVVARAANAVGTPCVAIGPDLQVGSRELRAAGIEAGYGVAELLGPQAGARPATGLADVASRVARTWSRGSSAGSVGH